MDRIIRLGLFVVIIGFIAGCKEDHPRRVLFERQDSLQTNVGFVNRIAEEFHGLTVLDYLYYYNGGGVASGDINNDGLMDLFFVSNHEPNKLFLNEGNFQFRDITLTAGVGGFSQWKTGVTVADVNGDGWLDIYVCALGNFKGIEGSNELYINNGDNTFTEKSAEVGLDFSGMATQSVFVDYDHDGDLDMYLVTHAPHTARSYDRVMASMLTDKVASDRLFRNDDGVFKDVTEAAGIDHDKISYGMSATVADIDGDEWEDIYVANDFYEEDAVYINKRDGTFAEKGKALFDYHSRYAHGCDIADINNDGYEDIMTTDIRVPSDTYDKTTQADDPWETFNYKKVYNYHLQFSKNVLQVNNQGLGFSEVGAASGIEATGWTWSVLLADFNNDGWKDIFTTNGIPKRLNDLDYLEYAHKDSIRYALELSKTHIQRALDKMPGSAEHNFIFENVKGIRFTDQSTAWGFGEPGFSNGAVNVDLDNDGDLDIVTNEINGAAGLYRNNARELYPDHHFISVVLKGSGKNTSGIGANVFVKTKDGVQVQHSVSSRGFLSAASGPLLFGLGKNVKADSVIVVWNDQTSQTMAGVNGEQQIIFEQKNSVKTDAARAFFAVKSPLIHEVVDAIDVPFVHKENEYFDFYREPTIPFLASREGPALAVGDVNGDGLDDVYVGGAKHQPGALYIQDANGKLRLKAQAAFEKDRIFEDVDALWLDVDGDSDLDLYVVSGGNEFYERMDKQFDRLYRNDGKGNLTRDEKALPPMFQNKSCVRAADIDSDGDIDLFVGGRVVPFHYGEPASSYILINDGKGSFTDQTSTFNTALSSLGMVTDAQWGDLDKDGDQDIVVVGEWMAPKIFLNENKTLIEAADFVGGDSTVKELSGFWQCVSLKDVDKDGDLDIVAGNLGLNSTLGNDGNTSLRLFVDVSVPGGKSTPIMARKRNDGKYYPLVQWGEWQKIFAEEFVAKYPLASDYEGKDMGELRDRLNLSWKTEMNVDQLGSVYGENSGGGKFEMKLLPESAQQSTLFAIEADDVNGDGNIDLLLAGNNSSVAPHQGSYLANKGLLLLGNLRKEFVSLGTRESGLYIKGDVRNIRAFRLADKRAYLIAINNDSLKVFTTTK